MDVVDVITAQFKIATVDEVPEIVGLCNECFFEDTRVEDARKTFIEGVNDPNQIYLVGYYNGIMVAHTKITIIPTIFKGMDTYAILNHVCVKPEYRKHKIATNMLDEVTRICKEKGCNSLKLWSNNFRIPAHACYDKYGFERIDTTFFAKEI